MTIATERPNLKLTPATIGYISGVRAGATLADMRKTVGLSRAAVAREAGISVHRAAKAEASTRITDDVCWMACALGYLASTRQQGAASESD
jgi:hypothetical protein